jgi:hypothetical protein
MAGVETESRPELANRIPEPSEPVKTAGHRVVAARGVLDQDRQRKPAFVARPSKGLAPIVVADLRVVGCVEVTAVHDQPLRCDLHGRFGVLGQQLAARDADAVVQRGHVEHIGRMDVDRQAAGFQRCGLWVLGRLLPTLRVGQEELDDLGAHISSGAQRIGGVDVRPDCWHAVEPTTTVGHLEVLRSRRPDRTFGAIPATR